MSDLDDLKRLADSYAIKYTDKGNGHIQLSNHGVLLNYYPLSKNRTVFVNGETIKHCSNWDAVRLCMQKGKKGIAPKKSNITKNRPEFDLKPVITNPSNLQHPYSGSIPPWEFPAMIGCWSDIWRGEAKKLIDMAKQLDCPDAYMDAVK